MGEEFCNTVVHVTVTTSAVLLGCVSAPALTLLRWFPVSLRAHCFSLDVSLQLQHPRVFGRWGFSLVLFSS